MSGAEDGRPVDRVVRDSGVDDLLDVLGDRIGGADLTTLLLDVMRRRADRVSPADVLRQYATDRFVAPGVVDLRSLRAAEDQLLGAVPDSFDVLTLSPLVPRGAYTAVAPVHADRVVATIRGTEVAADPTNALALEAAGRRRSLCLRKTGQPNW